MFALTGGKRARATASLRHRLWKSWMASVEVQGVGAAGRLLSACAGTIDSSLIGSCICCSMSSLLERRLGRYNFVAVYRLRRALLSDKRRRT